MLENVRAAANWLLGLETDALTLWQVATRVVVVYVAALTMVRLGNKRFLGKHTAFDVILGVMFGSVASRAITGSGDAPFFAVLAAGFALVGLHALFSTAAFHSARFGTLVKGRSRTLITDGAIDWDAMAKSSIIKHDLIGLLRTEGKLDDPAKVKEAHIERSGDVSVIKRDEPPRVVEVRVEAGVQTIRIEFS